MPVSILALLLIVTVVLAIGLMMLWDRERERRSERLREKRLDDRRRVIRESTGGEKPRTDDEKPRADRPAGRLDLLPPPLPLLEALRENECVLFAGESLGALAGSPSTAEVLSHLLDGNPGRFSLSIQPELDRQLRRGETELAALIMGSRFDSAEIAQAVEELSEPSRADPAGERLLSQLSGLPFSGVATDGWTDALASTFRRREPITVTPYDGDAGSLASLVRSEAFFIAHLLGTCAQPQSLRAGWPQYRVELRHNREFERFIASLAASRAWLFLGTDLATIETFFESSVSLGKGNRSHFALVPWEPSFELRAEGLRSSFGVELIPLDVDRQLQGLSSFVSALYEASAVPARSRGRIEPRPVPRLEAVRLANIGPFESLEIPMHPKTTVVLGDNGSGKSSLLRAISLALCGEGLEVDRAANGLLRAGAKVGHVELLLDGEPHRILLRSEGNSVSVRADQLSPVAAGLWLGLGFPPLRGIPGHGLEGPGPEPPADPAIEDVVALAGNWIDERLSGVQQWIVNTAVRADSRSSSGRANARLLSIFFSMVGELTPGVDFEFAGIDRERWRVLVQTDDGVLELDQLSRGMTAVFSWVGVMLQRLFRVYDGDFESAESQRALVLVDEIDLHLHPEWQRQILPLVGKHFPNVQLVATTHSPLVVGSESDAGLVNLHRRDGTLVAEAVSERFAGWRSDQILTSSAFDLATTRDHETEAQMAEYRQLLARGPSSAGERGRAEELAERLRELLPARQETEVGRAAAELVREAMRERLEEFPPERREEVFREADAYLEKLRAEGRS